MCWCYNDSRIYNKGCDEMKKIKSKGSLGYLKPDLAQQWHPSKNGDLTPFDVAPNSHKRIWWMCPYGHEWEDEVVKRNYGKGCPYDSRKKS